MRRRLLIVTSALALLAAACGGAAGTTPPSPVGRAPAASATRGPSVSDPPNASPALPAGEPMALRVIGDGPVIEGDVDGPEGYPNDYPGAIVRAPSGTTDCWLANPARTGR